MKRSLFMFVSAMLLMASSSVYADCNCAFRGGSFVASRPDTVDNPFPPPATLGILDQYIFNADGTAYWQQSSALFLPLANGVDSAGVGSWKVKNGHIYLTTIGFAADPVAGGTDLNLVANTRVTQKFKIIDKDTLEVVHRVIRDISTNNANPTNAEGTVFVDSRAKFRAHRVKVKISDLK